MRSRRHAVDSWFVQTWPAHRLLLAQGERRGLAARLAHQPAAHVLGDLGRVERRRLGNDGRRLPKVVVAAVAERVGWIENQSASLEEALEELSLILEERNVLEPLQRVASFRKRATSFRKAGPESQAL